MYRPIRNSADLRPHGLRVEYFRPPQDLAHLVSQFWEYSTNEPRMAIQVYPSGSSSLGFTAIEDALYGYFYGPILGSSVLGEFVRGAVYFGAAFRPGAELLLKNFCMSEIKATRIDVAEVWGREMRVLANAELAGSHQARYGFLVALLRQVTEASTPNGGDCRALVTRFLRRPGENVHEMAHSANVNDRRLRRYFNRYLGLSPKELESIVRVQSALDCLVTTELPISQLASDAGFSDQAHFTRRFSAALGDSPESFRRKLQNGQQILSPRSIPWHQYAFKRVGT